MMPADKQSLTQLAAASPKALSRRHKLPFAEKETAPSPVSEKLPPEIETVPESQLLPPNELYIDLKLPPEVAILHVYQQGENRYSLWGGNANINLVLPSTKPREKPEIALEKLITEYHQRETENAERIPGRIRDTLYAFSFNNVKLCQWLKNLRCQWGEKLYLIIADHTAFEIPWEMVELSPDDSPNEYIGALITTVRWQAIRSQGDFLVLKTESQECCGQAIAYILDSELKKGAEEVQRIGQKLQAIIYRSKEKNIADFQAHLQRQETGVGLIYLSCHGGFNIDPSEIWLGSEDNPQQRIYLTALRRCQLALIKASQGIVFMNACHSGRHQASPFIPNSYRLGFIELFLSKGARGVIGTLGRVGDEYAAQFAFDLIEELFNSPNLPVAAIIRKLRAKAINKLAENPTTEDLLSFIYTFMYVYYGNPMTVLRLTPAGGNPDV